jgi:dTDP-D-glucose 4,6-dehydratase
MVEELIPGSHVRYAEGGGPDLRCYRVNCDKIARSLPQFQPQWTVRQGIEQLYNAYREENLAHDDFVGSRYTRIKHIKKLQTEGRLNASIRWESPQRFSAVG